MKIYGELCLHREDDGHYQARGISPPYDNRGEVLGQPGTWSVEDKTGYFLGKAKSLSAAASLLAQSSHL